MIPRFAVRIGSEFLDALVGLKSLFPVVLRQVQRAQFSPCGNRVLLDAQDAAENDAGAIDVSPRLVIIDKGVQRSGVVFF